MNALKVLGFTPRQLRAVQGLPMFRDYVTALSTYLFVRRIRAKPADRRAHRLAVRTLRDDLLTIAANNEWASMLRRLEDWRA